MTTLKEPDRKLSDAAIQRYKEEIVDSKKDAEEVKEKEVSKKADSSKKTETAKKTEATKKIETSKKAEVPKTDNKKTETAKKEAPKKTEAPKKIETPQAKEEKKPAEIKDTTPAQKPAPAPKTQNEQKSKFNFPAAKNGAQLIFVFDDGGQNLSHLAPFLKLPFPITVAVLPQITHSKESAAQVRASGNELILHQPMQSVNASVNPGPGAIKPDMTEDQIKSLLF